MEITTPLYLSITNQSSADFQSYPIIEENTSGEVQLQATVSTTAPAEKLHVLPPCPQATHVHHKLILHNHINCF